MSRGVNLGFPCEAFVCIIEGEGEPLGLVDTVQMGGRSFRDQSQIKADVHMIGCEIDETSSLRKLSMVDDEMMKELDSIISNTYNEVNFFEVKWRMTFKKYFAAFPPVKGIPTSADEITTVTGIKKDKA